MRREKEERVRFKPELRKHVRRTKTVVVGGRGDEGDMWRRQVR